MSSPPVQANLQVKADNSCNWRCCFGNNAKAKEQDSPQSQSYNSHTTVEKITTVIHEHHHKPPLKRSPESAFREVKIVHLDKDGNPIHR